MDGRASVIVVDGEGVGIAASDASAVALSAFHELKVRPRLLLEKMQPLMGATVGAAVAIAELDARSGNVTFAGAGKIACRIVSSQHDFALASHPQSLAASGQTLEEIHQAWPKHSIAVLHADGLAPDWELLTLPGLLHCGPAVIGGWLLRDHRIAADDVTLVVLKRS